MRNFFVLLVGIVFFCSSCAATLEVVESPQTSVGHSDYNGAGRVNYDITYRKVLFYNESDFDVVIPFRSSVAVLRPGAYALFEMELGEHKFVAYAYRYLLDPAGRRLVFKDYIGEHSYSFVMNGQYVREYGGILCGYWIVFNNSSFWRAHPDWPFPTNGLWGFGPFGSKIELYLGPR